MVNVLGALQSSSTRQRARTSLDSWLPMCWTLVADPSCPGVHDEGLESLIVVHAAAHVEGRVYHSGGVVALSGEYLGECGGVFGERLPSP